MFCAEFRYQAPSFRAGAFKRVLPDLQYFGFDIMLIAVDCAMVEKKTSATGPAPRLQCRLESRCREGFAGDKRKNV